jgi:hypothetical protein
MALNIMKFSILSRVTKTPWSNPGVEFNSSSEAHRLSMQNHYSKPRITSSLSELTYACHLWPWLLNLQIASRTFHREFGDIYSLDFRG